MHKDTEKQAIIFGTRPLIEAYRAGKEIEKVFLLKGGKSQQLGEIIQFANDYGTPIQYVPMEKLNRLTRKNHQGVVAFVSEVSYQLIEQLIPMIFERGEDPFILVLDRITDVRNLGAIARSAEASGVHALLVPTRGSAIINADAVKTSAGALNTLAVCRAENLKKTLSFLKDSGLQIAAVSEKSARDIWDHQLIGPIALLLGSEEDGISEAYLKLADARLRIPMTGRTESLNVSVAAGVACFEVLRQRKLNQ
jgi:23S rRNA (guanosine2251-2'-O)-methyltransferase